jgi:dTDP-4-dehydrorhamnose reductase
MTGHGPVVVTGAAGQLGWAVAARFADCALVGLTRADLDIEDPVAVRDVIGSLRPSVVVNCAAYNDVDGAEDDPGAALAVNAFAVRSLARAAATAGAAFVHYSTDFVFDGVGSGPPYVETDRPAPASAYAASKLAGEWFALEVPRAYVLRVESLFGCPRGWTGRVGTLGGMVARLEAGEPVRVFTDRVVTPSRISDIAAATRHLIEAGAPSGIYHCVNSGVTTWAEVAEFAAAHLGVSAPIVRTLAVETPTRAARPLYCALDNARLTAAGFRMPRWDEAVAGWLADR